MPRWRQATVEDYDRVIAFFDELGLAAFREMQRQCRRERKSLVLREKAKRQHQDPEYTEKLRQGRMAAYQDPEREAIRIQRFKASFRRNVSRALPDMTPEQFREYKRLRHEGATRPDALRVVLSPRRSFGITLPDAVPQAASRLVVPNGEPAPAALSPRPAPPIPAEA